MADQAETAKGCAVQSVMMAEPWTAVPSQTLAEMVNQIMLRHAVSFVPVVDGKVALGYIDTHILKRIDRENWASTKVGDVFVARDLNNCVSPQTDAADLLLRIEKGGARKCLVVDGENLAGVITLSDLVGHMSEWHESGMSKESGDYANANH